MNGENERVLLHKGQHEIISATVVVGSMTDAFGAYAETMGHTPRLTTAVQYSRNRQRAITYALTELAQMLEEQP